MYRFAFPLQETQVEPTSPASVSLCAYTHRPWYLPGEVVRLQVSVEACATPAHSRQMAHSSLVPPPEFNYFCANGDCDDHSDAVVLVRTLIAVGAGTCSVDSQLFPDNLLDLPTANRSCKGRDAYTLFSTPAWTLGTDVILGSKQCRAFSCVFKLPQCLPSSFDGGAASLTYSVSLSARWNPVRANVFLHDSVTELSVPITVFSSTAVFAPTFVSAAFPLSEDDPIVQGNFDVTATPYPGAPTSAISAPLEDVLVPGQAQVRPSNHSWLQACMASHDAVSTQKTIQRLHVPLGNRGVGVTVRLASSTVVLGAGVIGSMECDGGGPTGSTAPLPIVAHLCVEMLECCYQDSLRPGAAVNLVPVEGMKGIVRISSKTVATESFVLLDSPKASFSLSICPPAASVTVLTDVVCVLWRLRLEFVWATQENLTKIRQGDRPQLDVGAENVQAVIPLVVVPPPTTTRNRCGILCRV